MNPYLEMIRPGVCGLAALGIIIGALVLGILGVYPALVFAVLSAFILCAAGDVINDFFDAEIDKTNAPHRPIPSGQITQNQALHYYLVLSIIGLLFAFMISLPFFAIAIFNFAIITFYSWFLKKIPFVKNLAVAWLGSASFVAAGLIVVINLNTTLLALVAISFIVVLGREIIKDIEDMRGDSAVGLKTLPMVMGVERSHILAFVFVYIGCALLYVPLHLGTVSLAYLIGAVPAVLLCIYAAKHSAGKARKIIKTAMYLVFLAFILGAIF